MAPRITPVQDSQVSPQVRGYFELAERRGAPNATLLRILARQPQALTIFYEAWNRSFYRGQVEHETKELMRVRMARLRACGY